MRMAAFGVLDSLAAAAAVGVLAASAAVAQIQDTRTSNPRDLRPLASFSGISDQAERSRALFNEIAKVVTHPRWQLAPMEMAWEGKSVSQICQQLKDPARNGGRTLALLHEHLAKDDLVAWGWAPGEGREPAPGSQQQLGELAQAWIDNGAQCP